MKKILFLLFFFPVLLVAQINEKKPIEVKIEVCETDATKLNLSIFNNDKGVFPVKVDLYECLDSLVVKSLLFSTLQSLYTQKSRADAKSNFAQIKASIFETNFNAISDSTYLDLQYSRLLSEKGGTWKYSVNGASFNTLLISNDSLFLPNGNLAAKITAIQSLASFTVTLQGSGNVLNFSRGTASIFVAVLEDNIYIIQKISS